MQDDAIKLTRMVFLKPYTTSLQDYRKYGPILSENAAGCKKHS